MVRPPWQTLLRAFDALVVLVGAVALLACLFGISADSRARASLVSTAPVAPRVEVAETERDGVLQVTVVGVNGQAIAAAQVRLFWERERRYFDAGQGAANGAGVATLGRVPRGPIWVLAEAEGFARASTQLVVEGGTRQLKLTLLKANELSVKVTDEAHVALADATVLVTTADPLPFGALTDALGTATLHRLGVPPFTVKASAPGFESVTRSGVSGKVEIALRRLGSILVHVKLPDGAAAAGSNVEIGGATLWPARSAVADANGNCKIGGLLAGSYDLRATKGELVSRVLMGFVLARGEGQEVTLTLEPGRFVTALVTDGTGPSPHLVSNADVVLAEEGLSTFPLRGRSGTDGKVT
ncbi:MAG TPA: carboxypeptidase-like regulatory domain-containing protein, partial [Polyangiaceae bacterium]|nr:carboxypeptidase-like regulatory domain-containing protein [Polyangiaceae bacterium]